ncbi:MAG: GNAT family N-acetyltransferase [Candidatus Shapirobacteria bacterium]
MEYKIRQATREELNIAIEWAADEGWNPGLYDGNCFYSTDTTGFYMGFLDGQPISSISAVAYDEKFGFIGFYIVKKEFRGQGYGFKLWNEALKHLSTQNIGLDGVISQQENYQKSGFKLAYRNIRYEGKGSDGTLENSNLILLKDVDFDQILNYDNLVFPTNRSTFLKSWIQQPQSLAIGYVKDSILKGYGMVRPCRQGYKIGPLFADNQDIAEILFQKLQNFVGNNDLMYLDVPEMNSEATKLANKYGMKPMFETARMYTKGIPTTSINKVYGVTTFELG